MRQAFLRSKGTWIRVFRVLLMHSKWHLEQHVVGDAGRLHDADHLQRLVAWQVAQQNAVLPDRHDVLAVLRGAPHTLKAVARPCLPTYGQSSVVKISRCVEAPHARHAVACLHGKLASRNNLVSLRTLAIDQRNGTHHMRFHSMQRQTACQLPCNTSGKTSHVDSIQQFCRDDLGSWTCLTAPPTGVPPGAACLNGEFSACRNQTPGNVPSGSHPEPCRAKLGRHFVVRVGGHLVRAHAVYQM